MYTTTLKKVKNEDLPFGHDLLKTAKINIRNQHLNESSLPLGLSKITKYTTDAAAIRT